MARDGLVATGHGLASVAGHEMIRSGGSAIDAGIAGGICLSVLLFDQVNFGGVAPIALFHARSGRAAVIDGLGVWPQSARQSDLVRLGGGEMPSGIARTVTPAAPDAWLTALELFGTLTVGQVLEPAWELASRGAPVSSGVAAALRDYHADLSGLAPTTVAAFFPDGRLLEAGMVFARPELARVLKALMDEEARARRRGASRAEAIRDARDLFYKGWIATEIAAFQREHGGFLTEKDLASYSVEVSEPLRTIYRDRFEVLACGPWCQGPALLQALNIMEQFDLQQLEHNSPEYLHLLIEAVDLAYADREAYYGDPRFVDVPLDILLAKTYAETRASTIDRLAATGQMPSPGDARHGGDHHGAGRHLDALAYARSRAVASSTSMWAGDIVDVLEPPEIDTSFVGAVDAEGNMFAATPSDPIFLDTPVVPSLGFSCSSRGSQSRLDADHPSRMDPGKRPRMTPAPTLVLHDGEPLMAVGCPGGDAQPQGILQMFVNVFDFGMTLQEAIEAPRVTSWNFPNSFAPHEYYPGRVDAEGRIPRATLEGLAGMGHRVCLSSEWSPWAGAVYALMRSDATLFAGVDPREDGVAVGW